MNAINNDFDEQYEYEVQQGESLLTSASKVQDCIFSGGVGSCLAILVSGTNLKEKYLGVMHYEAGRPKKLNAFLQKVKQQITHDFKSVVIGGYKSPPDDLDSGSEEDLQEICDGFKKAHLPISKIVFNPTDTCIDIEDVGDHYIDVKVDNLARFYFWDHSKDSRPTWKNL